MMTSKSELKSTTADVLDLVSATQEDIAFDAQVDQLLIGQRDAKVMLRRINRAYRSKLRDRTRPIYKAMLVGKSHVGKTETARTLAQIYHGNPDAFVKIDCETFVNKGDMTRLTGSGPSWVGFDDPRKQADPTEFNPLALLSRVNLDLSKKGSTAPVVIILFDEIEKAKCEEFAPFLLKMLDTGKIVLANNVTVDMRDCIILMTSNIGMQEYEANRSKNPIGFATTTTNETDELTDHVDAALKQHYPPEFLNRLEETCIYSSLTTDELRQLVELEIRRLEKRINENLQQRGFKLTVEPSAVDWLRDKAVLASGDAAELKRVFPRNMTDPLSEGVNRGLIGPGDEVIVDVNENKIALEFRRVKNPNQIEIVDEAPADQSSEPEMLPRHVAVVDLIGEGNGWRDGGNKLLALKAYAVALEKLDVERFVDHPFIGMVFNQFGTLSYADRDYEQALKYFDTGLRTRQVSLTRQNWGHGICISLLYINVFRALKKLRRHDEAKTKLEEAVATIRKFYPAGGHSRWVIDLLELYAEEYPDKKKELFQLALDLGVK
jgi:tetratricopeptide (TPR) repeat protein